MAAPGLLPRRMPFSMSSHVYVDPATSYDVLEKKSKRSSVVFGAPKTQVP